ncbi:CopG family nickel-responsive transcriptional regulator [Actimicrobium sp. GrIS 1.19]|uniref:nickel-responsive transcriptional regulator NikR n=1 Tax=Actimicrobium sp. GrIS 1.19 TaxID=3071708 RepID=UPI002DFF5E05|nr:CopG family nickel-responsive transcriptional regulator [Actimicrobium sp. GrIS 1.19]
MRRITISVEESLAEQFDKLIETRGYANRSEAFRDLLRNHIESERKSHGGALHCIATVSYIYNHHERELSSRLASAQHDHHDLCVTTTHVHLDHDNCLETVVLRGRVNAVSAFADSLVAQSGVRHGNIHIVPVQREAATGGRHPHVHLMPRT